MGKKSQPAAPAPVDYAGAAKAQGQANVDATRIGAELNNTNQITPYGNQTFAKNPKSDQWTSTISLSPEQQNLYDMQVQGQQQLGRTALGGLGRVQDSFAQPIDTSGIPGRVNNLNYDLYSGQPNVQGDVDFSGLGKVPGASDFAQQGQDVRDALYRQSTSTLDPQFAQEQERLGSELANKGVNQGTEAYDTAMNNFARQRQGAYGDARDRSIAASGAEQSRLNSDALSSRAQMLSQILSGGAFHNDADQQRQQEEMNGLTFNNNAKLTGANFQNAQRGAGLDEAAYLRSLPLNEYNALATGAQVTNPNFRGTAATQGPNAAPVFAAAQQGGADALSLYNAQMDAANSSQNGLLGTIGTVGGAAITAF